MASTEAYLKTEIEERILCRVMVRVAACALQHTVVGGGCSRLAPSRAVLVVGLPGMSVSLPPVLTTVCVCLFLCVVVAEITCVMIDSLACCCASSG